MRIVHVTDWYIPNMGYQENFLPAEQARLGHEVIIVTSGRLPPYGGFAQAAGKDYPNREIGLGIFEDQGVRIYRLPSYEFHGQAILIGLMGRLKELNPDIIHLHTAYAPTTIRVLIARGISGKLFIDDHSHENNFKADSILTKIYLLGVKVIHSLRGRRVSRYLPVTKSASRIMRSTLNVGGDRISMLPLGANTRRFFRAKEGRTDQREELGLDEVAVLVVTAGKFSCSKDIDVLIKAFHRASEGNTCLKLLLIGSGPNDYMDYLGNLIEARGLHNKIVVKGFVPNSELPSLFNSADIGVWPGDHSITAVEAVATGLPIIVPEGDEAYELVLQNGAGIGFERGDVHSLEKAIRSLAEDNNLRTDISDRAASLAADVLSWEKIAERSLEIYRGGVL